MLRLYVKAITAICCVWTVLFRLLNYNVNKL